MRELALRLVEPSPHADDVDVVGRCLHGDKAAQRALFRAHFPRVHATAYRILGTRHEAEDVAQEAFVEAFRSLKTFEARARFATWLDRIVVRVAFRHVAQRRAAGTFVELVEVASDGATPEGHAFAREGVRRLYATLDELPTAARVAFTLYAIDGRSVAEVATLTDASVVAVKVRLWRARQALGKRAASDAVLASFIGESEPSEVSR